MAAERRIMGRDQGRGIACMHVDSGRSDCSRIGRRDQRSGRCVYDHGPHLRELPQLAEDGESVPITNKFYDSYAAVDTEIVQWEEREK